MKNYIEFYMDTDGFLSACIHKDGKVKRITDFDKLDKLINICKKHGIEVKGERLIKRAAPKITKEYDGYIKRIKRLRILGNIKDNMKLSFKNIGLGKKIAAMALAGTITVTSVALIDKQDVKAQDEGLQKEYYGTYIDEDSENNNQTIIIDDGDNEINVIMDEYTSPDQATQLDQMFQEEAFHFSYENRVNNECYQNAMRYEDLFEKYANMYGVDKNLLIAIASQESSGDHYNHLEGGPAIGIMQIEKSANLNQTIEVYNFDLGRKESVEITLDKLQDIEQNIKIGAMLLRYSIVYSDYNIPIGIQNYNFGFGNMGKVLQACSINENVSEDSLRNSQTNNSWLEYRNTVSAGDPQYIEHIFSYIPNNSKITIKDTEGNNYSVLIQNDFVNENEKTNF